MFPSEITMKSHCGYYYNVPEGWQKLPEATIIGDGYTVEFSRLSERTIDRMCDALNGWYNVWTKFCCEYRDDKGTLSITVSKPEDADKLFNLLDIENLREAIEEMGEEENVYIREFYYEGLTARQIAERHDISLAAAWKRLYRSIDKLRKIFNKKEGDRHAISIPIINPLTIIELPPDERKGIVTPVKGIRLHEPNIFSAIWTVKAAQTQADMVP